MQLLCQLPPDRLNPGPVFNQVGVNYTGPIMVKSESPRKPFVDKAYVSVFVSFTVKAVHLEPVSELMTAAFIATLRRFMARCRKPMVIWSDHDTNFVDVAKELKELYDLFKTDEINSQVAEFCSTQNIQ